ncbi:MAG: glycoside hydrolase family 38 C-terminal domain-containing protein [Armatimonadota bacterium]|nr:glycoside hydrolase family 38 C-terminal domain-containing protein [Armatimonadota bacterium]
MEKKYTMVLVSHTHWDREWYLPFQEFRIKLVRLTDKLLKILDTDPDFRTFVFDGQTVVLEDYLEIRPHERNHIAQLVRSGRLKVGPWYILPDEWLVSGEATVRNLLLGHLIAEQFGQPMKAGYVPDPFGHISQMPQILRGFGIEDFYFSRGRGLEEEEMTCEFWWEAPDGTRVMAVTQGSGYCSASSLGLTRDPDGSARTDLDLAVEQIAAQRDKLAPLSASTVILLNNGCDHLEAQPEIPEIIRRANEKLEDAVVIHGSFEDVGRLIKEQKPDLPTYRGELRSGRYCGLLPGILSTRMYIKQANERTQTLLEKWTEPFCALANIYGSDYDSAMVRMAWRLCLQNHPHDSICGCSVDQVHKEMMPRFDQSQQIGNTLAREGLQHLASRVNTVLEMPEQATPVVVFNAHGWDVNEAVTVRMSGLLEPGKAAGEFVVRDSRGVIVPCQVTNIERTELSYHKLWRDCDLVFNAGKVPALGYKSFSIERVDHRHVGGQPALRPAGLVASENSLENEHVKISVRPNGSFDLLDKTTDNLFEGLNLFEDTEDAGDEYDYSPARLSRRITSSGGSGTVEIVESGPVCATIRVHTQLELPAGLSQDRSARSCESISCPVTVSITVRRGLPRVDITTEFANNAKDHRLRAWFPVGVAAKVSQAEGQFCVVERSIDMPSSDPTWNQKPQPEQPQQSFVNVQANGRGLTVINQGLPECEVMRSSDAVIALTLLRCCAWLSTGDLLTRDGGAGPEIKTPDAQCLGSHTFRYAVYAHGGDWKDGQVWRQAHQHNVPLRAVLTGVHPGVLPTEKSFISIEPKNLVVSALKKADRDDSIILRLYNTTDESVTASVRLGFAVKSASLANMNEEPAEELSVDNGLLSFDMPAFRVQTIRLSL